MSQERFLCGIVMAHSSLNFFFSVSKLVWWKAETSLSKIDQISWSHQLTWNALVLSTPTFGSHLKYSQCLLQIFWIWIALTMAIHFLKSWGILWKLMFKLNFIHIHQKKIFLKIWIRISCNGKYWTPCIKWMKSCDLKNCVINLIINTKHLALTIMAYRLYRDSRSL